MARSSAVPRTLAMLRDEKYFPWIVESYNAFSGKRNDMYGFADIIAITDQHTVAVQVCGADFSSHVTKMTTEREAEVKAWLRGPFREVILIGWRKVLKKRGGKQKVFKPRIMKFFLDSVGSGELHYRELKDEGEHTIAQAIAITG
jgi:hypothetical protein